MTLIDTLVRLFYGVRGRIRWRKVSEYHDDDFTITRYEWSEEDGERCRR